MSRVLVVLSLILTGCGTQAVAAPESAPSTSTSSTALVSTTTSGATSTELSEPEEPAASVLVFGGDSSFTHGMIDRDPFGDIDGVLSAADLTWINLETAIVSEGVGTAVDKEYVFRSPPSAVDLIASAGIDGVALANNDSLDAGIAGLEETLRLLDSAGVAHAGGGMDLEAAVAPSATQVNGLDVAVLSFSRVLPDTSWMATGSRPGLASAYHPHVEGIPERIAAAAGTADVVVVMVHWGLELSECPEPYQRDLARSWAAAGADVIVGSHPHVLQGVERIEDTWVLYSTGNLVFPSAFSPETTRTALFRVQITGGVADLQAVPLQLVEGRPTMPADGPSILEMLTSRSFSVRFDDAGRALPGTVPSGCG